MKKYLYLFITAMFAVCSLSLVSCGDDDDHVLKLNMDYDVLQINGENYACYGYRSFVTFTSSWNMHEQCWSIILPCGKLSDAKKGEYDYDYYFSIDLIGYKGYYELLLSAKTQQAKSNPLKHTSWTCSCIWTSPLSLNDSLFWW